MKSKNLIILCIFVIIVIASISYAVIATSQTDTSIKAYVKYPFYKNDQIEMTLTDEDGNKLANKTISLSFTDINNKTTNKKVTTDNKGIARYKVKLSRGTYSVVGMFSGDEHYKSANFTYDLKVKEEEVKKISSNQGSSSNYKSYNNDYYGYDSEDLDNIPGLTKIYDPDTKQVYYHDEYMD